MTIGILFVCTANICRSPMAEGVFRTMVRRAGLSEHFIIDSAGTSAMYAGQPPTPQAVQSAKLRGYDISEQRSRPLTNEDLEKFTLPLAMDRSHLAAMRWMAPRAVADRPQMFMKFAPQVGVIEVADPYGGPPRGYEAALDLIEAGCKGLLDSLMPLLKEKATSG
jgi:protein-tyrosine phosphatase